MTDVEQSVALCRETRKGRGAEGAPGGRGTCRLSSGRSNSHLYFPAAQHPPNFLSCQSSPSQLWPTSQVGQDSHAEQGIPASLAFQTLQRPPTAAGWGGGRVALPSPPRSGCHFGQGSKLFSAHNSLPPPPCVDPGTWLCF